MRLIITLLLLSSLSLLAALPVDQTRAEATANSWTAHWAPADGVQRTIQKVVPVTQNGVTLIYAMVYNDGFVLLAADDAAHPIIGYGYQTRFSYPSDNPSFNA